MNRILSIDQGGTKTEIVIADREGNLLGFGDDRSWVPVTGERRAVRMLRIRHAADMALRDAGLSESDIDAVFASCNGADWEFEYPIGVKNISRTLGIPQVRLYNDCMGALRGGTETKNKDCAIICLGSGANCAVLNREGDQMIYAYYLKSEHQGAGAIGRALFQAVLDARIGLAEETALTGLLLEETGYGSVDELNMAITTGRTEDEKPFHPVYKDYSALMFKACAMGDRVALNYVDWLTCELANYVIVAARKLGIADREFNLVLSGGVLKSGDMMVGLLQKFLADHLPGAKCLNASLEPVIGALLFGFDEMYPDGIPSAVMDRIKEGCADRKLFRQF